MVHGAIYAVAVAVTTYAVLELDNPRTAFIQLEAAEEFLRRLRDSIL